MLNHYNIEEFVKQLGFFYIEDNSFRHTLQFGRTYLTTYLHFSPMAYITHQYQIKFQ